MIAGARDRVVALAGHRQGTRADLARGVDGLPATLLHDYSAMIPTDLQDPALQRALGAVTTSLNDELQYADPQLVTRITHTIESIGSVLPPSK